VLVKPAAFGAALAHGLALVEGQFDGAYRPGGGLFSILSGSHPAAGAIGAQVGELAEVV